MSNQPKRIINELNQVFESTDFGSYDKFIEIFEPGRRIIVTGAGRVGLAMRGFTMRLMHLGFEASFLGETTVPFSGKNDVFVVGSGSGSTATILASSIVAKEKGLHIALITATEKSPIAEIANSKFLINAPRRDRNHGGIESAQPMTTLFEQSLLILLDSIVLDLMTKFGETSETMWSRHNSIE